MQTIATLTVQSPPREFLDALIARLPRDRTLTLPPDATAGLRFRQQLELQGMMVLLRRMPLDELTLERANAGEVRMRLRAGTDEAVAVCTATRAGRTTTLTITGTEPPAHLAQQADMMLRQFSGRMEAIIEVIDRQVMAQLRGRDRGEPRAMGA